MTLAISTVCTSISELTVTGVNLCDLDNVPASALRLTPILFPNPDNVISNFSVVRKSYGGGSSALIDVDYDLNYLFLYCELGSGRSGLDYLEDRMEKIQAIYDAILLVDEFTGGVDIMPSESVQFTVLTDPAGNQFLGCALVFHVKEFWR